VQKKKPVKKQTKKRKIVKPKKFNYEEITAQAISFLALNPGKNFQEFCKSIGEKYDTLRLKVNVSEIYQRSTELQRKKSEELLKVTEKELKKEGKREALNYLEEIQRNKGLVALILNKVIEKDEDGKQKLAIGFNSAGEALRCANEINKTNLLIDEKLREYAPPETPERNAGQKKQDERLNEFIELQKNKNAENIINNTDADVKPETPTN
jgi:hypothetical protein